MPEHALLSASSAYRWLECTAAPKAEALLSEKESDYTKEGKQAHKLAEIMLKGRIENKEVIVPDEFPRDMVEYVSEYVSYCMAVLDLERLDRPESEVFIEKKVRYDIWVPEGFGTADLIVAGKNLHIIDFKYGRGIRVETKNNPQLKLYALGALREYGPDRFESIQVHIFQPRLDFISAHTYTRDELLEWAESIRPAAIKAYFGQGEYKTGKHCQFCKASVTCLHRQETLLKEIKQGQRLDEIYSYVLAHAAQWESWIREVKEYALYKALQGETIPGFKLVRGRSCRHFTNHEKVAALLSEFGINPYKPAELKSITALEKEIGKRKLFEICSPYIGMKEAKPVLASEDDLRPEWNRTTKMMFEVLE